MGRDREKASFYTRGFTSFIVVMSFFVIAFTGAVLFLTPRGRVANWTDWTFLALSKDQWSSVHYTAATLFVIVAAFHIFFNWKVLLGYIRLKRVKGFRLKREFMAALGVSALFIAGPLLGIPGFRELIVAHDAIKDYWDRTTAQAPTPHAEDLSLARFARQIEMPLETVIERLRERGIRADNPDITVAVLAREYGLAPSEVHAAVEPQSKSSGHETHSGRGWGRMTIGDFCSQEGLSPDAFMAAAEKLGVETNVSSTLRAVAQSLQMTPGELIQAVREAMPDSL
jgi:hypothetical protein